MRRARPSVRPSRGVTHAFLALTTTLPTLHVLSLQPFLLVSSLPAFSQGSRFACWRARDVVHHADAPGFPLGALEGQLGQEEELGPLYRGAEDEAAAV